MTELFNWLVNFGLVVKQKTSEKTIGKIKFPFIAKKYKGVKQKGLRKTCACGKEGKEITLKCICEECLDFIKYAGHKIERRGK